MTEHADVLLFLWESLLPSVIRRCDGRWSTRELDLR
jgi:hypothetical protein